VSRCTFTARAEGDLEDIADYIAQDSPTRALAFVRRLRDRCHALTLHPYSGRARPELRPELRSVPTGSYVIFYRPLADGIEVVRVLHGRQDVEGQFAP